MTVTIEHLISHRFRGFAKRENSLEGLRAALDFGVKHLEFDIRVAACGTPVIFHDEHALDGEGKSRQLCEVPYSHFKTTGGEFAHFPTFEALLETISKSGNSDARFLIDIKDAGFETEIVSLVHFYRLHNRVTYVSWVPEALYACHELAPSAPLCLSYWCKNPNAAIRQVHKVFTAKDGLVPRPERRMVHGERSGWYIHGAIKGGLRDILRSVSGSVCVPVDMVSKALVDDYHSGGITVSTFSYIDLGAAQAAQNEMNIDLFFVDKKRVFDAL